MIRSRWTIEQKFLSIPATMGFALYSSILFSACSQHGIDLNVPEMPEQEVITSFPLDEYLGAIWGTGMSVQEQEMKQAQLATRHSELVAQCMLEAGFDYIPENAPFGSVAVDDFFPEDPDWVAQWGYGISIAAPATPTYVIGSHLSENDVSISERDQFTRALFGPPCDEVGEIAANGSCVFPIEPLGCLAIASQELRDETPAVLLQSAEFAPLFELIDQMRIDIRTEISPEETEWADCMADNGFTGFTRRNDPDSLSSLPENQIRDAFSAIIDGPGFNSVEMNQLQQREIELALTDLNCRNAVDFSLRETVWRIEAEQQFIIDNRPALEAIRDAAEQRE